MQQRKKEQAAPDTTAGTADSHLPVEDVAAVVIGGGPSGAVAAEALARAGQDVLLLDREDRIKPCGGAMPPRALRDFDVPESVLCARISSARMVGPQGLAVDMPIYNTPGQPAFVGMVDRKTFDPWLRERAAQAGAARRVGTFLRLDPQNQSAGGGGASRARVVYRDGKTGAERALRARVVIGADGASSQVARQVFPDDRPPSLAAYHDIVRRPARHGPGFDPDRADFYYRGDVSPDFYGWVFPHGDTVSIGMATAKKGFSLREATAALRAEIGLDSAETLRCEGGPIPMRPLKRWDNGSTVLLAGDASGVVAPASLEGIYYAMVGGRLAGEAAAAFLTSGRPQELAQARRRFMRDHGFVFLFLGQMQRFWYASDWRRRAFVAICRDPALQRQVWVSYLNKAVGMSTPWDQMRISAKTLGLLAGVVKPEGV